MRSMPFLGENIFSTKGLLVDHTPASVGIDVGFFIVPYSLSESIFLPRQVC